MVNFYYFLDELAEKTMTVFCLTMEKVRVQHMLQGDFFYSSVSVEADKNSKDQSLIRMTCTFIFGHIHF